MYLRTSISCYCKSKQSINTHYYPVGGGIAYTSAVMTSLSIDLSGVYGALINRFAENKNLQVHLVQKRNVLSLLLLLQFPKYTSLRY